MKTRKHLCLIMSDAKEIHSKRIVEGAISQCKKYGYDLSVFTTATTLKYFHPEYNIGASNIFNLINFELFDGVVIDALTLSNASRNSFDKLYERIKTQAKCPVVNLSYEYEDYKNYVKKAKDAGVSVIAYDRLIKNADVDMYISFDNRIILDIFKKQHTVSPL